MEFFAFMLPWFFMLFSEMESFEWLQKRSQKERSLYNTMAEGDDFPQEATFGTRNRSSFCSDLL